MDFKATIDLTKYTLALTAACFVYTLEKLVPAPTAGARYFVLALLALFVAAALAGLVIFSCATAGLHGNPARANRQKKRIEVFAYVHLGCLGVGVLLLGVKLVQRVLGEMSAAAS